MNYWNNDFKKHVGLCIAAARREKGHTQELVAERAELDRNYISEIERGLKMPTLDSVFRIAHALELKPSTLVVKIQSAESPGQ